MSDNYSKIDWAALGEYRKKYFSCSVKNIAREHPPDDDLEITLTFNASQSQVLGLQKDEARVLIQKLNEALRY